MLALVGSITVFASDGIRATDEPQLQEAQSIKTEQTFVQQDVVEQKSHPKAETYGELEILEDTSPDFDIFASFSISSSSLGINKYVASVSTYYIDPGKDKLKYSVNWSPTGQDIQIGFVSANDTSVQYWTSNKSGGSASGTVGTSNLTAGEYYVAIGTPDTNTRSVSVNGTFEWDN